MKRLALAALLALSLAGCREETVASAPPVMWWTSAPIAVVPGGAARSCPSACAAAMRPASKPMAALST